jgi:hypothetical protein
LERAEVTIGRPRNFSEITVAFSCLCTTVTALKSVC